MVDYFPSGLGSETLQSLCFAYIAGKRKVDGEGGALTRLALDRNGAAVLLYDPVGDRQPQARSFPDFLRRKEGIKDLWEILFGDAAACIGNDHSYGAIFLRDVDS